jgi:glutathionylspermidine synthase
MKRIQITPRKDYTKKLEELSFKFHSLDNPYWDESVYYQFNIDQVYQLEKATNDLYEMCLKAVQHVIDNNLFDKLRINPNLIPLILRSWDEEEPSVYGRFDLAYDGINPPKMLEFNADTPTSLYEASVVQWYWLQDIDPKADQFNSIHEKLIDYWKGYVDYFDGDTIHFSSLDTIEDFTTVEYLRDTADQAGLDTKFIYINGIGWDDETEEFVDNDDQTIYNIFKLYPWEWLIHEEYGRNILNEKNEVEWIEPAWKSILSNKGILAILWELFPNHENLLECYFDSPQNMTDYVEKPIYSREGANVSIYKNKNLETYSEGEYGDEGYVYQQLATIPNYNDNYPIIGSWVIGGESAGIGIRESKTEITDNLSRFIPHLIKEF